MRTRLRVLLATSFPLLLLMLAAGCGSSATTSTATSPGSITRCAVTGSITGPVPAQGGSGRLTVSAARECEWSASADGQWLAIKAGAAGQGDGAVDFTAAANPDPAVRRGAIVLNDARVEVMQAAGECSYGLSDGSASFNQAGGSGQFEVRASSSLCAWSAQSDAAWVVVRSGGSSKGTATVQFDVAAMTGQARSATITAAGQRFTVSQQPATCTFSVAPLAHTAPGSGGTLTVTVTTSPTCAWAASSAVPWASLSSPASVTGSGVATFTIAAASSARAGSVVVAGQTVAINQAGGSQPAPPAPGCSYALSSGGATLPSEGGGGVVGVNTAAGCPWSANSTANWLTITAGASGSGPGSVGFAASPQQGGGSRSGNLTIAGQTFTVTQAAGCSFTVAPEQLNVDARGGTSTVSVTAPGGCPWTTASNAPWISVRPNNDNGSGPAQVTVAENNGAARSGTAVIAGRTVTINQAAPACSYKVSPMDLKVDQDGKLAKMDVKTADGCGWSVSSTVPWVRVITPSGSGEGQAWIFVFENDEGRERSGVVNVADQAVTVTQKKK
jgi:hypothetical protein